MGDKDPEVYLRGIIESLGRDVEVVFQSNLLPSPTDYRYEDATLESFLDARAHIVSHAITKLCSGLE